MIKLFRVVIALLVIIGFSTTILPASEGKGQRIFLKKLRKSCGYNGFVMAKKHTQAEWTKISESGRLNETMENYCPNARDFKASEEKHVIEFLYAFASDSGQIVAG